MRVENGVEDRLGVAVSVGVGVSRSRKSKVVDGLNGLYTIC